VNRTILLVEDDETYAYSASKAIGQAGYDVIATGQFSDALRVLESQRVDLLLVDVVMPGQPHGFALARMARRRVPSLPIVYVTAYPDRAEPERDTALGEIVEKSLGFDALISQIKMAIKEGSQDLRR
jgi:CheY-like chemotaxis protein